MLIVQAEREGDWLLHMYALKRMVPYFFSAGHWHYARYIVWNLQDMALSLLSELQDALLREHVCRHRKGVWNTVFLDQFGEQCYIQYGNAKGGLVRKSLSDEQVAE